MILTSVSCYGEARSLEEIQDSGEIRFVIRNSPISYYEDRDGQIAGLDYAMANEFAEVLDLEAKFIVVDTLGEVLEELRLGKADIAAAGLSITQKRKKQFIFGPAYKTIEQQLICRDGVRPTGPEQLKPYVILVEEGSSYEEILQASSKKHPEINWRSTDKITTFQILEEVYRETVDCTLLDSNIANISRRYYPKMENPMNMGEPSRLAWAMLPDAMELHTRVTHWYNNEVSEKQEKMWHARYLGHARDFDPYDINKFIERIDTRLPQYRDHFQGAADKYGLDWTFLAAVAYQESHWDPDAVSPTGVRGLMMLTRATAGEMGVEDRMDPEQSIYGGAKYLNKLEQRIPEYIPEPDRRWMMLAAYNVGFAHLRDGRSVAVWEDHNPNRWAGVREALPLLSHREYYRKLPHGYARGMEPVIYVDRIRNYHDILMEKIGIEE